MLSRPLGSGILPRALSTAYGTAVRARNAAYDRLGALSARMALPVISVGSVHAGGVGKTPVALMVGRAVQEHGWVVAFLSRGYGRTGEHPVVAEPGENVPWDAIGDEPALLRSRMPEAWLAVDPDRVHGARSLLPHLPQHAAFVLDDGFGHRRLRRDLDIVCLPARPFDDHPFPEGYLREPISAIGRAGLVCLIGAQGEESVLQASAQRVRDMIGGKPVLALVQKPDSWVNLRTGSESSLRPCDKAVVLTGIARPERFHLMVEHAGIGILATHALPDHHAFTEGDLRRAASPVGSVILTTEKDAIRLTSKNNVVDAAEICYLKMKLEFTDPSENPIFTGIVRSVLTE